MGRGSWEQPIGSVLTVVLHTDVVSTAWALGLKNLQLPGPVMPLAGMPFDMARNLGCMRALEGGFDYVFHLDSDVIPPPDAVLRLMKHDLPIVSGLYCRRSTPHMVPVMMRGSNWFVDFPKNSLVEVDFVGAGCLLIRRDVLEQLPPIREGCHWFDWRVHLKGHVPDAVSEDFAFCFPSNTWVAGVNVKKINKVNIGDSVLTHTGKVCQVLDKSKRLYSGEMIRLTSSYMRAIESTPSHKFLVRKVSASCLSNVYLPSVTKLSNGTKGRREWVEAKDIKKDDWLCVPKIKKVGISSLKRLHIGDYINTDDLCEFSDGTLGYKRTRKNALRLRPQIDVTPELCRLIGYYIAEGSYGGKKHSMGFSFGETETEYVADCQLLLKLCFGAESSVYVNAGCARVICSSKILTRLFVVLCGHGAYKKHLPSFWFDLDQTCLAELLKGYWRGDGYTSRSFGMSTASTRLARELQTAFLRFDILCGVRLTNNGGDFTINILTIPVYHNDRFSDLVGHKIEPIVTVKQNRYLRETKHYFLVKVVSVEKYLYEGFVYNLKVEEDESYMANGVAVHNCLHAKRTLGISTIVDTSVICRHVGLAEAGVGTFLPCSA